MKTKIRTILHEPNNGYQFLEIQILDNKYPKSKYLEIIGSITIQRNVGDEKYYGLNYKVETDQPQHLVKMGKLATFLYDKTHFSSQPDEIKIVLNAEEYFRFAGELLPVSAVGQNLYEVHDEKGELYTTIIAKNEQQAASKLLGFKLDSKKYTLAAPIKIENNIHQTV